MRDSVQPTVTKLQSLVFEKRRSGYDIGIGYGDDIAGASRVILKVLREVDGVESAPAPEVVPWELAGSTVNHKVRWWGESSRSTQVLVHGRVISAVKSALTEAGVDLPFPTRVMLWHDQTDEFDGDRSRQREGWPAGNKPQPSRRDKGKTKAANESDQPRLTNKGQLSAEEKGGS